MLNSTILLKFVSVFFLSITLVMNIYINRLFLLLLLLTTCLVVPAQNPDNESDSTRISLLTCTPGTEIYALFGHTAIRYEDPLKGMDIVFNYGLFNFGAPNFIWRFVKGETDYELGADQYKRFIRGYLQEGRGVYQQTLNLTKAEKDKLYQLLVTNYHPENRVYRYSFFYDNCSTRPRDKVEESVNGNVAYAEETPRKSFRDIVHECSKGFYWDQFGMDFLLGPEADRMITYREEMFAPFYLMWAFDKAQIVDQEGNSRPLAGDISVLEEPVLLESSGTLFTPLRTFLLLFILISGVTIYDIKKKKSLWGIDLLLFAGAGLAGCIIFFLSFFSEHPAVSPNYLLAIFHPLHLLALPFVLYKESKGKNGIYHRLNLVVLTLFIVLWPVIPQYFNPAVLPLALCLLIRSASNIILTYKKKA